MQKNIQEYIIENEKDLDSIVFLLVSGDRVFFYGDLGSGKSTYIRHIIRRNMNDATMIVRSPTYTYYQKYGKNIYHCDLYRLEEYSNWITIGGEEIIEDPNSILLIEWPEILGESVKPTKKITIEVMVDGQRKISISIL